MEGENEEGNTIEMDGSPAIGGVGKGARPMQVLLMSLAGCSSIDVINILNKQKQKVDDYNVEVTAERREGEVPSLFKTIHLHYILKGDLDEKKVERAIVLSADKYCSVSKILEPTAEITWGFEVRK